MDVLGASKTGGKLVTIEIADKSWYKNYLIAVLPNLEAGGCYTSHNVLNRSMRGIGEFLDYVKSLPNMETTIDRSSRSGISISYKKSAK